MKHTILTLVLLTSACGNIISEADCIAAGGKMVNGISTHTSGFAFPKCSTFGPYSLSKIKDK